MSKYIDDIIWSIEQEPKDWRPLGSEAMSWATGGAMNDGLRNDRMGIIAARHRIVIKDVAIPSTFMDRVRLRRAIRQWYCTVSIYVIAA